MSGSFQVNETYLRETLLLRLIDAALALGVEAATWELNRKSGPLLVLEHPIPGGVGAARIAAWNDVASAKAGMETMISTYLTVSQSMKDGPQSRPAPSPPYTVAFDDRDPESPWVAQHTREVGRFTTERDARRGNMLDSNRRNAPDFPRWDEVAAPYANAKDGERFVVTLVVGYGPDIAGGQVTEPVQAAREALNLTRGEGSGSTVWHVFDRRDNKVHEFEQARFEQADTV